MKIKRLFAAILSAMMIISCFSFTANAQEDTTDTGDETDVYTITLNKLNGDCVIAWGDDPATDEVKNDVYTKTNNTVATATVTAGESYTIPEVTRTRAVLLGWATEKDGEKVYEPTATFTPEADVALFALWERGELTDNALFTYNSSTRTNSNVENGKTTKFYDAVNDVVYFRFYNTGNTGGEGKKTRINTSSNFHSPIGIPDEEGKIGPLYIVGGIRTSVASGKNPFIKLYQAWKTDGTTTNGVANASEPITQTNTWVKSVSTSKLFDNFEGMQQYVYSPIGDYSLAYDDESQYFDVASFAVFETESGSNKYDPMKAASSGYKISFDLNYTGAEELNGYVAAPERDGYTFLGWATSADATEVIADMTATDVPTEETTYYAIWASSDAVEDEKAVYVSADGDDANSGRHSRDAVKTMKKAREILEADDSLDTVYLVGTVTLTSNDATATGTNKYTVALGTDDNRVIKYLGYAEDDVVDILDARECAVYLIGEVELDNFTFHQQTTYDGKLMTEGHDITIGEDMKFGGVDTADDFTALGAGTSTRLTSFYYQLLGNNSNLTIPTPLVNTMTINGSKLSTVQPAIYSGDATFKGEVTVNVNKNAEITTVRLGGQGYQNTINTYGTIILNVNDNAKITNIESEVGKNSIGNYSGLRSININGGNVGNIKTTAKASSDKGDATKREHLMVITVNGGTVGTITKPVDDENEKSQIVVIFNDGVEPVAYNDSEAYILNVTGGNVKADVTVADDYTTATLNKFTYTLPEDSAADTVRIGEEEYALAELGGEISLDKLAMGEVNEIEFFKDYGDPEHIAAYRAEGYEIVYVSKAGAGDKSGLTAENAKEYTNTVMQSVATGEKGVFAFVDQITIGNIGVNPGATVVITENDNNGIFYFEGSVGFTNTSATTAPADIIFDNIHILHKNDSETGESIINMGGNNLTFTDTVTSESSSYPGKGPLNIHAGVDGTTAITNSAGEINITLNGGSRMSIRSGGWGGSQVSAKINYVAGGNAHVSRLQAGGHSAGCIDDAQGRTQTGDVTITVKDNAVIDNIVATNHGILNGSIAINIQGGEVAEIAPSCGANGAVNGNMTINVAGGKVGNISAKSSKITGLVTADIDLDEAELTGTVDASVDYAIAHKGDGSYRVDNNEGVKTLALIPGQEVKYIRVTNGTDVKEYNVTGDEVTLMADLSALALGTGLTTIEFLEDGTEAPKYTLITPDDVLIVENPTDSTGIPETATFIAADSVKKDSDGNELNVTNAGNYGFEDKYFDSADATPVKAVWYKNVGYIPYYTGLDAGTYNVTFRLHLKANANGVRGFSTTIDDDIEGTVHVSGTTSVESKDENKKTIYTSETFVTFEDVELSENALIKYGVVGGFDDSTIKGGDLIGIYVWQPLPETVTLKYYDDETLYVEKTVDYGATDDVLPVWSDVPTSATANSEAKKYREDPDSNDTFARPDRDGYYFVGWAPADSTEVLVAGEFAATEDASYYAVWEKADMIEDGEVTITLVSDKANSPIPEDATGFYNKFVDGKRTGPFAVNYEADGTEYVAINAGLTVPGLVRAVEGMSGTTTTSSYYGSNGANTASVIFPEGVESIWYKWNDGKYIGVETPITGEVNVAYVINTTPSATTKRGFYLEAGDVAGTLNLAEIKSGTADFVVTFKTTLEEGDIIKYAGPADFNNDTIKSAQLLGIYVWADAPVVTTANAVFDANGGAWDDGDTTKTVETVIGETPVAPEEVPTKADYKFDGWTPELTAITAEGVTYKAVWTATPREFGANAIYIDTTGDDANDGSAPDKAVKTLKRANELFTANEALDTLVVVNKYDIIDAKADPVAEEQVNISFGVEDREITITGYTVESVFSANNNVTQDTTIYLTGNLTFEKINFIGSGRDGGLLTRGYELTIGEGVALSSYRISPTYYNNQTKDGSVITLKSGSPSLVTIGVQSSSNTYKGTSVVNVSGTASAPIAMSAGFIDNNPVYGINLVNVDGGNVSFIKVGANSANSVVSYSGLRYFTINGGTVGNIETTGSTVTEWYDDGDADSDKNNHKVASVRDGITVIEINGGTVGEINLGANKARNSVWNSAEQDLPELADDDSIRVIILNNGMTTTVSDTGAIVVKTTGGKLSAVTSAYDADGKPTYDYATLDAEWGKALTLNGFAYELDAESEANAVKVDGGEPVLLSELTGGLITGIDEAGEHTVEFVTVAAEDTSVTVTWIVDGETVKTDEVEAGAALTAPAATKNPDKDYYYTFKAWNDGTADVEDVTIAPDSDVTYTAVFNENEMPASAMYEYESFSQVDSETYSNTMTAVKNTIDGIEAVEIVPGTNNTTSSLMLEGGGKFPLNYSTGASTATVDPAIYGYAVIKYYYVPDTNTDARTITMWYQKNNPFNDGRDDQIAQSDIILEDGKWSYAVDELEATAAPSSQYHIRFNGVSPATLSANGERFYFDNIQIFKDAPTVATVTFKGEDGTVLYAIDALNSEAVAYNGTAPEKADHTFKGWAIEGTTDVVEQLTFAEDTVLVPVFEKNAVVVPEGSAVYKTYGVYDEEAGTYTIELKLSGTVAHLGSFGFVIPAIQSVTPNTEAGISLFAEEAAPGAVVSPIFSNEDFYANTWAVEAAPGFIDATEEEVLIATFIVAMDEQSREWLLELLENERMLQEEVVENPDEKYYKDGHYLVAPKQDSLETEKIPVIYASHTDSVKEAPKTELEYKTYGKYNPAAETYTIDVAFKGGKINAGAFGIAFNSDYMTFDPAVDEDTLLPVNVKFADGVAGFLGLYPVLTEDGVAFVWDGSANEKSGYIDATEEEVIIATITAKMTAEQREAFVAANTPAFEILDISAEEDAENYFDGTDYLVVLYADDLEVERVAAPYTAHADEEVVVENADVKVKVHFTAKSGETVANIGYIVIGSTFNEIDAEGNEEATVEYTIKDAKVGEKLEFHVIKNGYIPVYVELIVSASGNEVEVTLVPGDIMYDSSVLVGDGEVDLSDFIRIVRAFEEDDSEAMMAYCDTVDINEDDAVTVDDLALVKKNFGKTVEDSIVLIDGVPFEWQ